MSAIEGSLHRIAGRVLHDAFDVSSLPEARQQELFEIFQKGKVILFGNDSEAPETPSRLLFPALDVPGLKESLEREQRRCDAQRAAFLEAQQALDHAGIPMLLFKSSGPYPYTSSNVDALVPDGEMERAAAVLIENGHHEIAHYWEPNKRLLRKFKGPHCEVMIHLHTKISWIVLGFSDMAAVWDDARHGFDPAIRQPSPSHLVATLLAHSVYESNKVHIGDIWKIRQAIQNGDFDWDAVHRIAQLKSWLPGLSFSLRWYSEAEKLLFDEPVVATSPLLSSLPTPSPQEQGLIRDSVANAFPAKLSKLVTKRFFFRKLLVDNDRSLLEKAHDLEGVFEQTVFGRFQLRSRPGSFICLCGIDGSGKSTHAENLRLVLDECEISNRLVWMRGGYSPFVTWIKERLRKSNKRLPSTSDVAAKEEIYRQGRTRLLWGWLVTFEQIIQAIFAVRVHRWLGRTLIAERYVPDTLADLSERFDDEFFPTSLPGRLMRFLTPRPDLILFLDVSGDVAFARKSDDWSTNVLEERRQRYRSVLDVMPQAEILDAEQPLEPLVQDVVDRSLRCIFGRIQRFNPLNKRRRDAWEE